MIPFDIIYCLNVEARKDRLAQFRNEMERINSGPYTVFHASEGDPILSFCRSQHRILKAFLETDCNSCLILEDDADFREFYHLPAAMDELPFNWDVLFLGGNVTDGVSRMLENQPEYFSQHLVRLKAAWTTQAVAYNRPMAQHIVANYDPETRQLYDDWLCQFILPIYNCYIIRPTIVWQRPGKSDLWGHDADYRPAFEASDEKLMKL